MIYYTLIEPEPKPESEPSEEPVVESDPNSLIEAIENLDWEQLTIDAIEAILIYLIIELGVESITALATLINPATLATIVAMIGIVALYTLIKDVIDNPGSTTSKPPCLT